jgi:oligogalacturonide transport system substrate-binding protein
MKKICLVGLCFIMFSALLFAGGERSSGGGGPVTLRFAWWGGDERHQATLKAIDLYQQRNPGVRIEAEYGGWDGYYEKLVTQLAGGTAADILQIDFAWVYELSSKGDLFLPLEGNSLVDISKFDRTFLLSYCAYDGKIIGVPTGLNGEIILVDTGLLRKSGIGLNTQWDWDNFFTEGRKVNTTNPNAYLLGSAPNGVRIFIFEKYLIQSAGGLIDENKKILFTEQQAEEAFAYIKSLLDQKILVPFSESSPYGLRSWENPDWINSNLGILHSNASSLVQDSGGKTDIMVASMPVKKDAVDSGIYVRPSQIMVVNNNSTYRDAAAQFMNFFFNDPEAIEILSSTRGIPPTTTGREILTQKGLINPLVEEATNIALSKMGKPASVWQTNSEITQILDDVVEKLGFGVLTPTQAAKDLRDRLSAKLASL